MAHDWDIKSRSSACHSCEELFLDQQECVSRLTFTEEGYMRNDYCSKCWEGQDHEQMFTSFWQGIFKAPPAKPEEAVKKETAETLLRSLMEKKDPANGNAIYILAVMLERKRLLAERSIRKNKDGTLIRVYEHKKTGETFLIPDPQLKLDQLEDVQEEVVIMLGGKPPEEPQPEGEDEENEDGDD